MVLLDYSGILKSFPQGGTGVTCPPLCALVVPLFSLVYIGSLYRLRTSVIGWLGSCYGGRGWGGGLMGFVVSRVVLPEYF